MKKIIILFLGLLVIFSCTIEKETPLGLWDDNIKLSQKEVQFTADANSIIITTQGKWWWISRVSMDEKSNFDLSKIDVHANDFIIDEAEFKIERKNTTEIYIEITENETGSDRMLHIGLAAGDYHDRIVVTQSAKLK